MGKNRNNNNEGFEKDMEAPVEAEAKEVAETAPVDTPVSNVDPIPEVKPEPKKEIPKVETPAKKEAPKKRTATL